MCDPVVWLWSFADFDEPVFDEASLRIVLGEGVDRLMSLNFVVRTSDAEFVTCPSCIDGHKEEVVVLDWPDGSRRYFVPCPEYLRVEVPRELLEQWAINWNALASAVAAALSLGGTWYAFGRWTPVAAWSDQVAGTVSRCAVCPRGVLGGW